MREHVRDRFLAELPGYRYAGVLVALAVGDQRAIDSADWLLYMRTGVGHLMSISGLHVTMVAGLFAGFVHWLWRRSARLPILLPARKAAAVAAVVAASGYCLLAGYAVPAQRTFYMLSVVALALWADRMQSASRVLCLALLAVLLLDPWAVIAPGFWLSFAAVALMLYVGVPTLHVHWLAAWARVQGAITLGLAPLLLVLFQQVSLVSPLANAIAIPVVSFVVTPLALAAAITPGPWLAQLAHALLEYLMQLLAWLDRLPLAVWEQHAPATWTLVPALIGVVWMLAPRGIPARYLGVVLLLPMYTVMPSRPAVGAAWLDMLDVGLGSRRPGAHRRSRALV
jgi:competence protein ComEC